MLEVTITRSHASSKALTRNGCSLILSAAENFPIIERNVKLGNSIREKELFIWSA